MASSDAVTKSWLAVGWLGVAAVVYLTLTPSPPQFDLGRFTDKWEHVSAYAALMWWFCQVRTPLRERVILAALLLAMGIGLEFAQRAGGIRQFEIGDMVAGGLGVVSGWLLAPPRLPSALQAARRILSPHHAPK